MNSTQEQKLHVTSLFYVVVKVMISQSLSDSDSSFSVFLNSLLVTSASFTREWIESNGINSTEEGSEVIY